VLTDDTWEQALESALRKRATTVDELIACLPELSRARTPGVKRMRGVLGRRPPGAPPTESLLETLFLQLARRVRNLGEPVRQLVIDDRHGQFVARVDLAWPELGLFIELDGMQHAGQPLYDARRETAVIAATGWLVGRFTWDEVVRNPVATARRLEALVEQARRRQASAAR
jgi:very-short-patch-repair endonuclease